MIIDIIIININMIINITIIIDIVTIIIIIKIIMNINLFINIVIININIIMNIIIIIITNRAAALARARSAEPRRALLAVTGRASRDRGLDSQTRL